MYKFLTDRKVIRACMGRNNLSEDEINVIINVSKLWDESVEEIKHKNRFFPKSEIQNYLDMLLELKKAKINDTVFYRARNIMQPNDYSKMRITDILLTGQNDSGIHGFPRLEMEAPPIAYSIAGRANPAGISYLYLASNPQTACAEIRPILDELISVIRFKINNLNTDGNKICVIDLKNVKFDKYTGVDKIVHKYIFDRFSESFYIMIKILIKFGIILISNYLSMKELEYYGKV